MSGQWPPEWEDPDDESPDAGLPELGQSNDGHSELELSEVTSFLASVRSPALPASFEARISAAIAAEAATRAAGGPGAAAEQSAAAEQAGPLTASAGADAAKDTDRSGNPEEFSPAAATSGDRPTPAGRGPRRPRTSRSTANSRPGGSRPGSGRRRRRLPSMQAASWTLVSVLVLAGFGFLVTHSSQSSSSSAPYSASSASAAAGAESSPAAGLSPEHADVGPEAGGQTRFLVHSTGTSYQRSTLASQVRDQLAVFGAANPTATPASSASAATRVPSAAPSGQRLPSAQLEGCVSAVTGGVTPSLVDKASYDGIPAYIIATSAEVWVVRRGCTAADTQLIAAEPLKG
jgi:hypothetical protein